MDTPILANASATGLILLSTLHNIVRCIDDNYEDHEEVFGSFEEATEWLDLVRVNSQGGQDRQRLVDGMAGILKNKVDNELVENLVAIKNVAIATGRSFEASDFSGVGATMHGGGVRNLRNVMLSGLAVATIFTSLVIRSF